jgi:hypothetical protein
MNFLGSHLNLYSALVDKPGLFSDFHKHNKGPQNSLFAFLQPLAPVYIILGDLSRTIALPVYDLLQRYPLQDQHQLSGRQLGLDTGPSDRHLKGAFLQSLAIDAIAISFPLQQLDMGPPSVDKNKHIPGLKR